MKIRRFGSAVVLLGSAMIALLSSGSSIAAETFYTVTHYEDGSEFMTGHERILRRTPEGFRDDSAAPRRVLIDCAANLMNLDQKFSLQTMRDRGVITQEEYHFFAGIAAGLDESQVVFFHQYRQFTRAELQDLSPAEQRRVARAVQPFATVALEMDDQAIDPLRLLKAMKEATENPKLNFKEAALYLVRGQGWDLHLPRRLFRLPWQAEDTFKHAADLNRIRMPLVFELGRAAQAGPGKIQELLKLAVVQMSEDAHIYGIPPEQVQVFVHATDQEHIEIYQKHYGFKFFAKDPNNPENQILVATLADLQTLYPVDGTLSSIPRIRKASGYRLSVKGAAQLQRKLHEEFYHFVDSKPERGLQSKPIFLMNELKEAGGLLGEDLLNLGITDRQTIDSIMSALNEGGLALPYIPKSLIAEASMELRLLNGPKRALRIQNVDPAQQREDKDYLSLVLLAVRDYYARKINRTVAAFGGGMQFSPPVYAIVTSDPDLIRAAKTLGAQEEKQSSMEAYRAVGDMPSGPDPRIKADIREGVISHLYIPEVVLQMLAHHRRDLAKKAEGALSLGRWHENASLHYPLLR